MCGGKERIGNHLMKTFVKTRCFSEIRSTAPNRSRWHTLIIQLRSARVLRISTKCQRMIKVLQEAECMETRLRRVLQRHIRIEPVHVQQLLPKPCLRHAVHARHEWIDALKVIGHGAVIYRGRCCYRRHRLWLRRQHRVVRVL
jgi:hypothetical protein